MSKRTIDHNGFWEVEGNPIAKVGVFPYLGREINAPEPDKIYYVYRPAEELSAPETIDSFRLIPFVDEHEMLGVNATPAERKGVQGAIGERVYFDEPYLKGNLRIWSDAASELINNKTKIELSPGYRCKYDFTPGEWNGQRYDAVQRHIRANHLALVREGRSGPDISVQDHSIITIDTAELIKMTLEEILQAIAAMSEEDKAQLRSALATDPAATTDQDNPDDGDGLTDEERAAAAQAAAELEAASAAAAEAAAAAEQAATTGDEEAAAAAEAAAAEAAAQAAEAEETVATIDALHKEVAALRKQIAAQDTASILKQISQRDQLAERVSNFIGTFDHAGMTLNQVAAYGVEKLGIKCPKGQEAVALDVWMQGRVPEHQQASTAMDSRPLTGGRDTVNKLWSNA